MRDMRRPRTRAHARDELIEQQTLAFGQHLDLAREQIARVTGQSARRRLALHEPSETDALHESTYHQMTCVHRTEKIGAHPRYTKSRRTLHLGLCHGCA